MNFISARLGPRKGSREEAKAKTFMICRYAIKDHGKEGAGQDLSTLVRRYSWGYMNREYDF